MTDITVRALGAEDWQVYRDVRLRALAEAPDAFAARATDEQALDESFWRARMDRSRRLIAERDGDIVGVVSVRPGNATDPERKVTDLFGLWVTPEARGTGVAWKLVEASVEQARTDRNEFLVYWVGTDNGRGVAFASSFGFRPTDGRRPMKVDASLPVAKDADAAPDASDDDLEQEMAMVYPLGSDPVAVPSSVL